MKNTEQILSKVAACLVVLLATSGYSCSQKGHMQLEIKETSTGNSAYTGDFLIYRLYDNGEVEFDCTINSEPSLSEANIKREHIRIEEKDYLQLTETTEELINSNPDKYYASPEERSSDAGFFTKVEFTSKDGVRKNLGFQGHIGQIEQMIKKQTIQQPLMKLLNKITELENLSCR